MKKDLIFAPIMLIIGVVLALLKVTGLTAHIAVSVVGILVLLVYSALTKKQWKIPALEIVMRAFYGIALISGVIPLFDIIFGSAPNLNNCSTDARLRRSTALIRGILL